MFDLQNLMVCLIEPSRTQRHIIQHHLREMGIENIDLLESGAQGLERMRELPRPDITISAMYLPDMTGAELVMAMRADGEIRDMPYVLISSETRAQQLDAIRQAGALAILPKPFTTRQLDRALCSALDYLNTEETRAELEHYDLDTKRILLVDDSSTSRHYLRTVLERMGFMYMDEAANGMSAIPLLQETQYDLIITDYNMPEMDGRALIEYVRTLSPQMSVPILMVSGEQDETRLAAVEEAGVSAICDKPFEMSTLRSLIVQFL